MKPNYSPKIKAGKYYEIYLPGMDPLIIKITSLNGRKACYIREYGRSESSLFVNHHGKLSIFKYRELPELLGVLETGI
jgi:hypothetical protein